MKEEFKPPAKLAAFVLHQSYRQFCIQ